MHQCLISAFQWIIVFFLIICAADASADPFTGEVSINCGSSGASVSLDGRPWLGDFHSNLTIEGSSARSTVARERTLADPVPHKTARISRTRFSYIFRLNSGQKLIRLHFNPTSYSGFESSDDLFTVRAGRFTLLSNFSASITANALGVNFIIKEFCIILDQNCLLNVTFSPAILTCWSRDTYAFINAIQVISVPESLSYTGDNGIQVLGEKYPVYIDNSTALEMVHRQSIKRDCVSPNDDFPSMFGMSNNQVKNSTWRVSVDIGFRYLVRFHFSELGLKIAENGSNSFSLVINHMVAYTNARVVEQKKDQSDENGLVYRNYMVMAKGCKLEGKRDIFISLQPKKEFIYGHGPLQGFEIFKLSNPDDSLGSPNPSPPEEGLPFWTFQHGFSVFGNRNTVATAVIVIICLVNVIVHMLRQSWEAYFPEEKKKPTTRVSRICRRFSLPEIQAATRNFHDSVVIGKGGFGKVYRGFIGYSREIVAIKRLKTDSKQGSREFWTEVETLSELRHVNLVSLIGYCNEQQEMILVYDYMPNGTLADHLYKLARKKSKFTSLSWEERLQICIGAGRGLDYLHTGKGVIHRDVKASNILLDECFVAKVSDFGLAKTECLSVQYQNSTNVKGTFGYIDPDYFKTHKLTTKSDTYAFGVVLLEVLCGRPAVDPLAGEDECSLTTWARDNIRRGKVDQILAPCLSDEISPDSLTAFLKIVESCLHDEPIQRPPIVHAIIGLEFALELQKRKRSLSNDIASLADLLPFTNRTQQENANHLVTNEITNADAVVQCDNGAQLENATSLLPDEITGVADVLPRTNRTSRSTMQLTVASSHMQSMTGLMKEETDSRMAEAEPPNGKTDGQKTLMNKLSRLFSWVSIWKSAKPSKRTQFAGISKSAPITKNNIKKEPTSCRFVDAEPRDGNTDAQKSIMYKLSRFFRWHSVRRVKLYKRKDFAGISISAPLTKYFSNKTSLRSSRAYQKTKLALSSPAYQKTELAEGGNVDLIPSHNLRIYSFSELKVATRNFRTGLVLGEGGFGRVYKGFLQDKSTNTSAVGSFIAVKQLNRESRQGLKEWLSEIKFLGKLFHPNLVKLLGYCINSGELLLVYEYMQRGSLDNHIFLGSPHTQPLSWSIRLKILIGAARGLAYLHSLDTPIICRDFKTSNILLDESYNAKLSDFGLARLGACVDHSHVSTQVMGTYGYAAPEYMATGHLYVKSDVYSFGVVLLEMLTGFRAVDTSRPSVQQNLVDCLMPIKARKKSMEIIMDARLEGRYPSKSALQVYQLAKSCVRAVPKDRPSMKEVVEILEAVKDTLSKS